MQSLTLTDDQEAAYKSFCEFLLEPDEKYMVIEGYAGTGKSFLVGHILQSLPAWEKIVRIVNPSYKHRPIALTATTNKACSALKECLFYSNQLQQVSTIHSYLGLRLERDRNTGDQRLRNDRSINQMGQLIFVDEASFIDIYLLKYIEDATHTSKVVFLGDPAQLTQVRCSTSPVFSPARNWRKVTMTEVMRQDVNSPIQELSAAFRNTVNTGEFFSFAPDAKNIIRLSPKAWEQALIQEFTDPNWKTTQSKVLAWTNKCVQKYNAAISTKVKGTPEFQPGDLATVNKYVPKTGLGPSLKTDEIVTVDKIQITSMAIDAGCYMNGYEVSINNQPERVYFLPSSWNEAEAYKRRLKKEKKFNDLDEIERYWIDLRATYACTVNKAQGSTFDKVFIDLNDLARCRNPNQLARMLYVAVSRARTHVFFTGDLI